MLLPIQVGASWHNFIRCFLPFFLIKWNGYSNYSSIYILFYLHRTVEGYSKCLRVLHQQICTYWLTNLVSDDQLHTKTNSELHCGSHSHYRVKDLQVGYSAFCSKLLEKLHHSDHMAFCSAMICFLSYDFKHG